MAYTLDAQEQETLTTYNIVAPEWNRTNMAHWKDRVFYDFVSRLPGNLLLDIGCGTGWDAELFTSEGLRYVGIDISSGMLTEARKDNAHLIDTKAVRFARMNMAELGFHSDTFDGFSVITSLMHIPRPKVPAVLSEIYRVTKPGGAGWIAVPYGTFEGMYGGEIGNEPKKTEQVLSNCWLPETLEPLLIAAGFTIVMCHLYSHMLFFIIEK